MSRRSGCCGWRAVAPSGTGPGRSTRCGRSSSTAPDDLRQQLRGLTIPKLVRRTAAFRPAGRTDVGSATRVALRTLARRVLELDTEVAALDEVLEPLVAATAPEIVAQVGVGNDTAGALLVAAGENPSRLRNERSFARLCGASPLDASSGKHNGTASAAPVTDKPTPRCGAS